MQKSTYILDTDGSYLKNPGGSGGYGVILINISTGELADKSEGFFSTTNNRMEVMTTIEGLAMVPQGAEVELVSDSQYLVRTLQGAFAKKKNHDLWAALDRVMAAKASVFGGYRGMPLTHTITSATRWPCRLLTPRLGKIRDTRIISMHQVAKPATERRVRQSCLNAIEEANWKEEPRFKDFVALKTGELDGWSSLVDPRELVG